MNLKAFEESTLKHGFRTCWNLKWAAVRVKYTYLNMHGTECNIHGPHQLDVEDRDGFKKSA